MDNGNLRRVAVLGGSRIPFARQNGPYAQASNQDMLTATLDSLVDRFGLDGEVMGEVAAGAVLKHSRDFNLTRESVLGSRLAAETPAYDVQQACGTGLEATILVANKIALGQIDCGIAGGVDTTSDAPLGAQRGSARAAAGAQPDEVKRRAAEAAGPPAPRTAGAGDPAQLRAAHRPVDGRAHRDHGPRLGHRARGPGRAGRRQPPPPGRRLRHRLDGRPGRAVPRARARPEPAPGLQRGEAGQAQARVRRRGRHDDRRQLDAAVRRRLDRAARLRGMGPRARHPGAGLLHHGPDRRRRLRAQARGAADGARLRDAEDARPRPAARCRTSTSTRSTRRSPLRCCARSRPGRTRSSAPSGSASTAAGLDRPRPAQRPRRIARRRPSVRRHRRTDRRLAGQGAE